MKTKTNNLEKFIAPIVILLILSLWQIICSVGLVADYMLPSPINVVKAFASDLPLLLSSSLATLWEAFLGLVLAVCFGFAFAVLMDNSSIVEKAFSPLMLLTQTVPPVAIAPLLILWFGYGVLPKVLLVFLTCFFPITVGLLTGLKQSDPDAITLLKSMGANKKQLYYHIKLPGALPEFFSGLRISSTYALVSAVVAEWLGGNNGLGVYMTRVRKSYSMDKMFAVIFLISFLSLLLIQFIKFLEKKFTSWNFN